MNYNYDIHQITDQKTTVDRVSSPSQPSVGKVPPPFKLRVPFVAQVVGVLSALVLVAGAMTTRQLISTNTLQDTAAADIKAEIYLEPETSNLNINQEKTIELRIKTNGLKLNGTDFTLHFDKSFITISDPQFVNGAFPVPVESPVIDNAAGTVKAVLVNLEEEVTDADVLVMTMKVKAKTELGSTLITIDPDVMITAQEELVNVAKIKGNGAS